MVRDLREKTGAGMMECKKATELEGDMDKATQLLRERGQAVAAKREGKQASEGIVYALIEGNKGVMVEINCEILTSWPVRTTSRRWRSRWRSSSPRTLARLRDA